MRFFLHPWLRGSFAAISFLLLSLSPTAEASDLCALFRAYSPRPDWYDRLCNGSGSSGNSSGISGGYSSFASAFNLNPASIPTVSLPLGVEYMSTIQNGSPVFGNFALIKGLHSFGAAISTSGDNTFYGLKTTVPSYSSTLTGLVNQGSISNVSTIYNFGTSASISDFFGITRFGLSIGVMARNNPNTKSTTLGEGANFSYGRFHAGYTTSNDPATAADFGTHFTTYVAGYSADWVRVEYTHLSSEKVAGLVTRTTGNFTYLTVVPGGIGDKADAISLSGSVVGFVLTGAYRKYEDQAATKTNTIHWAIQRSIGGHFSIGYLSNYFVGYQSLGIQVVL